MWDEPEVRSERGTIELRALLGEALFDHPKPVELVRRCIRLATDPDGFAVVRPTLQVVGCDDLFAVGDCAALPFAPWVRKAGVYAVRAGPVLDANLRARLAGGTLRAFRPQRDFLSLMNLGGRRALATKWGLVFSGRAAWMLKDRIDRGFVARYSRR